MERDGGVLKEEVLVGLVGHREAEEETGEARISMNLDEIEGRRGRRCQSHSQSSKNCGLSFLVVGQASLLPRSSSSSKLSSRQPKF